MKKEAVVRLLVILIIIVLVGGGLLLILNNKDVKKEEEEEALVSQGEVSRPGGPPPAEPTPEQQKAFDEVGETESAEECEEVAMRELCYLRFAIENNDRKLCEKLNDVDYKSNCLEGIK